MSIKKGYNIKRIIGSLLWASLGLATVVLLGAAINLKSHKHCKGVSININGVENTYFIDKKEIARILETLCGGTLSGKPVGSFNLSSIENTLKKDQWIKKAELFFDNNEVLRVNISEREPVARIFTTAGSSFYIDSTFSVLPLSDKFSARVPMFTNFSGNINAFTKADSNLLKEIEILGSYIYKDPFWMAQIDQVDITTNRTFEMIPKIGNQIITFGNADNFEQKFNNLLTFYEQVETRVGWNKYSKINVEYKDQIVAVKRGAEDVLQDSLRTKQLMQMLIANAQKAANDSINNIQLEQIKDDNNVPVATQVDDLPDEQASTLKPVTVTPNKTIQPSTEKPIATPIKNLEHETSMATKNVIVPEKKIVNSNAKPFWFPSSSTKPFLKKTTPVKNTSTSNVKPNPTPLKKSVIKSTTKVLNKPAVKKIIPPTKPKIKPKPITQLSNDY